MDPTDSIKSPLDDDDGFNIQACATTDCTGLIPALPQSDAEIESYQELYPYLADTGVSLTEFKNSVTKKQTP